MTSASIATPGAKQETKQNKDNNIQHGPAQTGTKGACITVTLVYGCV